MTEPVIRVPETSRALLEQLGRCAHRHGASAYAVGGCVRDWCLGMDRSTDLDVTVEGRGIEVAQAAAQELSGTLTVHQQFGTATVSLPSGARVDVATARRETYAKPAAYPSVTAGTLRDDLFRRDFTINAMAMTLEPGRVGALVDLFGGVADLGERQLRVMHLRSFLDDPTRILRGVRFLQRFGLRWEPNTEQWLHEAVSSGALGWLNPGRFQKELDAMMKEPDPKACLHRLAMLLEQAKWAAER